MIKRIFWDIDETLIYTEINDPNQDHIHFILDDDPTGYFTIIRPCALALITFSRDLIGSENVYILTTATQDYALKVNELAGFRFDEDHILHRGTIENHKYSMAYSGEGILPHALASKQNCLIDNLPWNYNFHKMDLIGITKDRYMTCDDYYGVNYIDESFENDCKTFLKDKHESS